jgi:hypothetical protein
MRDLFVIRSNGKIIFSRKEEKVGPTNTRNQQPKHCVLLNPIHRTRDTLTLTQYRF